MTLASPPSISRGTHEVVNQPGATPDHDAYAGDPLLPSLVDSWGIDWASDRLRALGAVAGSEDVARLAHDANRHEPQLRVYDRFGHRIDEVEFHPSYHELMSLAFGHEVHSLAWTGEGPNTHLARAALSYLWNQAENGVGCPTAMTYASTLPFQTVPQLWDEWRPLVLSRQYDPRPLPAPEKTGVTIGMAMTEKHGGSDLRQVRTTAIPVEGGGTGGWYEITGHKWFTSVPMSDGFFTLAQTSDGVSCLFFPRWLPDGERNGMHIQRLKDKCGNRSNASSEIELDRCVGVLVGEPGHGIREIIRQGHLTRMDFAVGSAGLMRAALTHAAHHATHRDAFKHRLVDLPLMRSVLADLELEVEAATLLGLRVALAMDRADDDPVEELFARLATPLAKYWTCRRAVRVVAEALECHGGNGFIEEGPMARLYREAPLNSIWEGTSNMMCLDVVRSLEREPKTVEAFLEVVRRPADRDDDLSRAIDRLATDLLAPDREARARLLADQASTLLCGVLLLEHAPEPIAGQWIEQRIVRPTTTLGGIDARGPAADLLVARAQVAG